MLAILPGAVVRSGYSSVRETSVLGGPGEGRGLWRPRTFLMFAWCPCAPRVHNTTWGFSMNVTAGQTVNLVESWYSLVRRVYEMVSGQAKTRAKEVR